MQPGYTVCLFYPVRYGLLSIDLPCMILFGFEFISSWRNAALFYLSHFFNFSTVIHKITDLSMCLNRIMCRHVSLSNVHASHMSCACALPCNIPTHMCVHHTYIPIPLPSIVMHGFCEEATTVQVSIRLISTIFFRLRSCFMSPLFICFVFVGL